MRPSVPSREILTGYRAADKHHVSLAVVASMFHSMWPRFHRKTTAESTPSLSEGDDCLDDQLLRSQLKLTWNLAKLALELRSDDGAHASSDVIRAVETALEKAERYSRQTLQNGLALTHLNALKKAIAGLGLNVATECPESRQEVTR